MAKTDCIWDRARMAGAVKDAEGPAGLFSDSFRVTLKTTIAINDFAVGVNCTVSQVNGHADA